MIDSEYYQNYQGQNLTQVILNGEEDITEKIKVFYGTNNNWQGKLWTYKDVFGDDCKDYRFYCEFHSKDKRKHWFHGFINDKNDNFNIPLHTPLGQATDNRL